MENRAIRNHAIKGLHLSAQTFAKLRDACSKMGDEELLALTAILSMPDEQMFSELARSGRGCRAFFADGLRAAFAQIISTSDIDNAESKP